MRLLHAGDYLLTSGATWEFVCFRQHRAFARHFADRAREQVVIRKPGHDLFGSQTFGNRDRVLHHLAFDYDADDIAEAGVLLE